MTPTKQDPRKSLKSPKSPQSPGEDGFYVNKEGKDDHIFFEPIVKLPEEVDLQTGEEGENVLYSHRAKLYRFVDNEWRERGLGDVKILQHQYSNKCRVVMRREQVLKLCLKHRLLPTMELKTMPNSKDKAWIWHAEDYADGTALHDKLAIKFSSAEIASQFKSVFDAARLGEAIPVIVVEETSSSPTKTPDLSRVQFPEKSSPSAQPKVVFGQASPFHSPFQFTPTGRVVFGGTPGGPGGGSILAQLLQDKPKDGKRHRICCSCKLRIFI